MMIKAKYESLIRPYMKKVRQGFGSLYGGNQTSNVTSIINERKIEESHESKFNYKYLKR